MFVKDYCAALDSADKRVQGNSESRVAVGRGRKSIPDFYLNAKFFNNLTAQAVLQGFAGIDLAAGELPLERQAHGCAPLGNKNKAVTFNESTGYMDMFHLATPLVPVHSREQLSCFPWRGNRFLLQPGQKCHGLDSVRPAHLY